MACSRGHSAGHFDTKKSISSQHLTELLRILSCKNMHYEKLNLVNKLISTFYIQLYMNVGISHSFR